MLNRFYSTIAALLCCAGLSAQGVTLYGITAFGKIFKINTETCETCLILDVGPTTPDFGINDMVVLPDGDILVITEDGLRRYDPPSPTPVWSNSEDYIGAYLGPDGLVYLSTPGVNGYDAGLVAFDPATNTTTFIGFWPEAMIVQEFFFQNGVLYAHAVQGPGNWVKKLVQVDLVVPGNTVIVQQNPPFNQAGGTNGGFADGGFTTQIFGNFVLFEYDAATNNYTQKCNFPTNLGFSGLTGLPSGVSEEPCICNTYAGSIVSNPNNPCGTNSIIVPYNNNAQLESGDILQYVLFTDLNDTLGSIIVQSNSPNIAFNPATMQQGVTYYIATIAGNNVGGNVDLNDPCVDISNVATVTWRPRPSVSFTVSNPDVCAGNCLTVDVTLTGSPVYFLNYSLVSNGNNVGTFFKAFVTNTGTMQVCIPSGVSPGSLTVQTTSLTDAYCPCF